MTDVAERTVPRAAVDTELHTNAEARRRLKKRYAAEARFKAMGLGAVGAAALFLAIFLYSIVSEGVPAFFQNYVKLEIPLDRAEIDPNNTRTPRSSVRPTSTAWWRARCAGSSRRSPTAPASASSRA